MLFQETKAAKEAIKLKFQAEVEALERMGSDFVLARESRKLQVRLRCLFLRLCDSFSFSV